jgi:hypothetical protein
MEDIVFRAQKAIYPIAIVGTVKGQKEIPHARGGRQSRGGVQDRNVRISVFIRMANYGIGIYPDAEIPNLLLTSNFK